MSRRKKKIKIKIVKDKKYNNYYVEKIINSFMKSGKKSKSEKIVYKALKMIKEKYKKEPCKILEKSLIIASPKVELRKRKIGGNNISVPINISKKRGILKAIKFLKLSVYKNRDISISLFREIIDTYNGNSKTTIKRDQIHKMAENNRAFTYYN